jgi:hypothetical protein
LLPNLPLDAANPAIGDITVKAAGGPTGRIMHLPRNFFIPIAQWDTAAYFLTRFPEYFVCIPTRISTFNTRSICLIPSGGQGVMYAATPLAYRTRVAETRPAYDFAIVPIEVADPPLRHL